MPNSPADLQTIRVHGTTLHYVLAGAGSLLVLVHGGLGDWRTWRAQIAAFAPRYRVLAYSRRGHYPNPWPTDYTSCTPALHAADLAALIAALDLGPAHLVANSYGGLITLALAQAQPALVRTLTLGEPPAHPLLRHIPEGQPLLDAFLREAWEPARQAFAAGDLVAGVRRFLHGAVGPGTYAALPPAARAGLLQNAPTLAVETATPLAQYMPDWPPATLRALRVPVLLLGGDGSPPMYALERAALAAALPHVEQAVIPHSAHLMHSQNPAAHDAAVAAFLARHGG